MFLATLLAGKTKILAALAIAGSALAFTAPTANARGLTLTPARSAPILRYPHRHDHNHRKHQHFHHHHHHKHHGGQLHRHGPVHGHHDHGHQHRR